MGLSFLKNEASTETLLMSRLTARSSRTTSWPKTLTDPAPGQPPRAADASGEEALRHPVEDEREVCMLSFDLSVFHVSPMRFRANKKAVGVAHGSRRTAPSCSWDRGGGAPVTRR